MNRIVMRIKKLTPTSSFPVTKGPSFHLTEQQPVLPAPCPAPFTSALNVAERRAAEEVPGP